MNYRIIKTAIVFLLIFSVTFIQIVPSFADSKKVRVAFIGIQFEELPADIQKRILEKVTNLFTEESSLQLAKPTDIQAIFGREKVAEFLKQQDNTSFLNMVEELDVDYIFSGRISNNSRESGRILLVGELYRYDRVSNLRHKYEVLKYYENFGVELVKFKHEFVKTIVPYEGSGRKIVPYLVLAGVILAGTAAFALVKMELIGSGDPGENPVEPH